jgi:hypothetical protein
VFVSVDFKDDKPPGGKFTVCGIITWVEYDASDEEPTGNPTASRVHIFFNVSLATKHYLQHFNLFR